MAERMKPWVIVGGGMVGAAAALTIAEQGYRVVLLEPKPESEFDPQSPHDLRISAITADNIAQLNTLGVWEDVIAQRAQRFDELAVRELDGPWVEFAGRGGAPLGYMVENKLLQRVLQSHCKKHPLVHFKTDGFSHLARTESGKRTVHTSADEAIEYSGLLGADGAQSSVRDALGLGTAGASYRERCLLVNVETSSVLPTRTWQVFSDQEVHALLPLTSHHACLIVYANHDEILALSDSKQELDAWLHTRFVPHIGDFTIQSSGSFPLRHQQVLTPWSESLCGGVIGDAAHAVHPLAGQGVNLGFRDVQGIASALKHCSESEAVTAVARALKHRRRENLLMGYGLDAIAKGFRSRHPLVQLCRRSLFHGLSRQPSLRDLIGRIAGGRLLSR
ncbi:FAD-dependent oxidoreductase [Aliidiomarina indica]|uniref:FAD-dependent oxidoreductase n=1 Tax=Aliidiomarina indica TaxID=2749147 RepID=UPI0018905397